MAYGNDELSNMEGMVTQKLKPGLPTMNNVKNIKNTKEFSLHGYSINILLIFLSKSNETRLSDTINLSKRLNFLILFPYILFYDDQD